MGSCNFLCVCRPFDSAVATAAMAVDMDSTWEPVIVDDESQQEPSKGKLLTSKRGVAVLAMTAVLLAVVAFVAIAGGDGGGPKTAVMEETTVLDFVYKTKEGHQYTFPCSGGCRPSCAPSMTCPSNCQAGTVMCADNSGCTCG